MNINAKPNICIGNWQKKKINKRRIWIFKFIAARSMQEFMKKRTFLKWKNVHI